MSFVSLKQAAENHDIAVQKRIDFTVDPDMVFVEPGFNRPINDEHVANIMTTIRAGGVLPPIVVRMDGPGRIVLVDGEHRWRAVQALRAEGVEIKSMHAIPFSGNDADRVAHMLTSAQGLPIEPLDQGIQYRKLIGFGWTPQQIAQRVGRTPSYVHQLLLLAGANSDVHQAVRSKQISSTVAARVVRKNGSGAGPVIAKELASAKARGKKRVTEGSIKKASPPETVESIRESFRNAVRDALAKFNNPLDLRCELCRIFDL